MPNTFAAPGTVSLGQKLTDDAAVRVARNWWLLLVNGLLLVLAGVLIFSIDWSVRSLATFIGALFIFEGISSALTSGIDATGSRTNVVVGLLSIAAGIAIIVWPSPGLVAVAVFLGAWLIVVGTLTVGGAFAVRNVLPDWWLMLITGLLEVPSACSPSPTRRHARRPDHGGRDMGGRGRRHAHRGVLPDQAAAGVCGRGMGRARRKWSLTDGRPRTSASGPVTLHPVAAPLDASGGVRPTHAVGPDSAFPCARAVRRGVRSAGADTLPGVSRCCAGGGSGWHAALGTRAG